MKHNKKRNTAFIYESLILEMTKSVLNRDIKRKNKIIGIIKEFFNSESILKYELEAYKSIYETKGVPPKTAERILMEAQRVYFGLNPQYVFRDQTKLIKKVNKDLGKAVFNNFLPNYKTLASISQIFNFKTTPKKKIILENNVLDEMTQKTELNHRNEPIDNIVYNTFVKKFNEEYDGKLLEEQKDLLYKYIFAFSDNGISLKVSLNEEIERLKTAINSKKTDNSDIDNKIVKVSSLLESLKETSDNEKVLLKVLQVQKLSKELA